RDRRTEFYREHRFVDRLGCRGPPDERSDDDLVLAVDDDRHVTLRLTHVALGAGPEIRGLLVRVNPAFLRLLEQQADRGGLGLGIDGARGSVEVGGDLVAERDLHSRLALVVPEMRGEL